MKGTEGTEVKAALSDTGIVRWFNPEKGYGFITSDHNIDGARNGGRDIFVHHSSILMEGFRQLNEGDRVEFEVRQGDKGLYADQVRVVLTGLSVYQSLYADD